MREDEGAKGMADGLWVGVGRDGNQLTKHSLMEIRRNRENIIIIIIIHGIIIFQNGRPVLNCDQETTL